MAEDTEKKDEIAVEMESEGPGYLQSNFILPNLPKPLTLEEKKYLLAVERGDMSNVRRILQKAHRKKHINMNCVDSLGRGAMTLSIDGENMEMLELLVIMGVQTKDALLHAIGAEFVEAVELLLEHEELIHKDGEPYSWQTVDTNTSTFSPDVTPLILAAHRNNYEIIKILLDRGATLPMPHDIKCGCDDCIRQSNEDSLRHSMSRVNEYRALASPSLMALSSGDPILTAFQLSWELRNMAFAEQECKSEYLELRKQCQKFAVDLLDQSRSSQELAIILNHDPDSIPFEDGDHMKLARLELAINYKQKKFVAHPNIQQLLAAIWYEGVPGFRRKSAIQKTMIIVRVAILFPLYSILYMVAPNTHTGKLMRKPFMKFLIHASSYLFFLFILILVSQRAEVQLIELFGTRHMKEELEMHLKKQRGNGPTYLELLVFLYVLGFIWEETLEIYVEGIKSYLRNMWNFIDFTRNFLYVGVALLRTGAYLQQWKEIKEDQSKAFIPREHWDPFDPQLIAEGLFAAANIFSALKLVHLFSINPHLGPLQISLGRMVIDIIKFFFIYSLVLFAFACGLNQLLWYFADLERKKCYVLPGGLPDWGNASDSCMKWRSFGNVFEASQSLFWASFGMIGLENFELAGIKSYTRFWGLLMFGSYSVINVIVLLNLLIAMMSNSYAMIDEHSDTEWKFARTKLWMSYFEESATLPPPFNIFPTPKLFFKLLGLRNKDKLRRMSSKRRDRKEKERDIRYTAVMRALVWRYVSAMHRKMEESPVTEDDVNEVKGDISAMRYEILDVLERNGMDVSMAEKREKPVLGKRMKIWERRLMKDFHVSPVAVDEDVPETPPENEDMLSKFRRIARLAVINSSAHKWGQVVEGAVQSSQIGRCHNREAYKNQQQLQKAMHEAKKLIARCPLPGASRSTSPVEMPETTGASIMELIKDITEDTGYLSPTSEVCMTLDVKSIPKSRSVSPSVPSKGKTIVSKGVSSKDVQVKKENEIKTKTVPEKMISPPLSPPTISIASAEEIEANEDIRKLDELLDMHSPSPEPLVSLKHDSDGSPPKVIKRKAPVPMEPSTKADSDVVISRPVPSEPQSSGTIPPPPGKIKVRPSSPHESTEPSRPLTPVPDAEIKQQESVKVTPALPSSPLPQKTIETTKKPEAPEIPVKSTSAIVSPTDLVSVPSTECLIPKKPTPEPLRLAKKVEVVKKGRRQPKTGWL